MAASKGKEAYAGILQRVARKELTEKDKKREAPARVLGNVFSDAWGFLEGKRGKKIPLLFRFRDDSTITFKGITKNTDEGITVQIGKFREGGFTLSTRRDNMVLIGVDTLIHEDSGVISRYYKQYILDERPYGMYLWHFLAGDYAWERIDESKGFGQHVELVRKLFIAASSGMAADGK